MIDFNVSSCIVKKSPQNKLLCAISKEILEFNDILSYHAYADVFEEYGDLTAAQYIRNNFDKTNTIINSIAHITVTKGLITEIVFGSVDSFSKYYKLLITSPIFICTVGMHTIVSDGKEYIDAERDRFLNDNEEVNYA